MKTIKPKPTITIKPTIIIKKISIGVIFSPQ